VDPCWSLAGIIRCDDVDGRAWFCADAPINQFDVNRDTLLSAFEYAHLNLAHLINRQEEGREEERKRETEREITCIEGGTGSCYERRSRGPD